MKKFFLTISLCMFFLGYSQGENDNWNFGKLASVNFSGPTPVVVNTSQMGGGQYPAEAAGTASDSNGKLLFYTNGVTIWNRNNQVMDNGSGMSGTDTTQQLVIVKSLSNPNQYYVFMGGQFNYGTFLRYSIVDMSLGGLDSSGVPLGRVLDNSKNILVTDNAGNGFHSEAVTVVPASDGTMWVLIPENQNLYSYNISSTGFNNGNPVVSALNFPFTLSGQVYGVKASPKLASSQKYSHYLCISSWTGYPDYVSKVYSFNYTTGKITPDFTLQINSLASYSPEFNLDSSILYLGRENLYAVDLLSATPTNINYMQIATLNFMCGGIQRNKYGDIYVSVTNSQYLSRILNPNVYGPGISFQLNNIFLGSHISGANMISGAGLPQLIEKPLDGLPGGCIPDITLVSPETNTNYTYQVSNTIVTQDQYRIDAGQNISMKAGSSISLLPDTFIDYGSDYLAQIEACQVEEQKSQKVNQTQKISLSINLDAKKNSSIKVYPNPVSDILHLKSDEKIDRVSVFDISGKNLNLKLDGDIMDVRHLPAGTYLIVIETKQGKTTEKFIKK